MAERTTRGWQAENGTVVVDAATVTDANAEARSEVEESVPARHPQLNPIAAFVLTAPLGASSSATVLDADRPLAPHMVAPAVWGDSSGTSVPDSTSVHIAHLRTLSNARAVQSNRAAADVASRTSLAHAARSNSLHLYRIASDVALLNKRWRCFQSLRLRCPSYRLPPASATAIR